MFYLIYPKNFPPAAGPECLGGMGGALFPPSPRKKKALVLDGREAPEKFSLLYIRFLVLGFEIPVPGIFFTEEFGHFLVTCFFFNYFFGKKLKKTIVNKK